MDEFRQDGREYQVHWYSRGKKKTLYARIRLSGEHEYFLVRSTETNNPSKAIRVVRGWIQDQQQNHDNFAQWAISDWNWDSSLRIALKRKSNSKWVGEDHCYNVQTQLKKYLPRFFPKKKLDQITPRDLFQFASFLLDQELKPRTVKAILTATRTSLRQAYRMGLNPIAAWPLPELSPNEIPRNPFTSDEIDSLLTAAQQETQLHAVIRIAAGTGARIGEIFAMRVSSVGPDSILIDRTLTRSGAEKPPKGGRPRRVATSPELLEYLRSYTAGKSPNDLVISNDANASELVNYRSLLRAFWKACRKAGIETTPRNAFHSIRHFHATELARIVPIEEVQRQLGHAQTQTTLRYVHTESEPSETLHKALPIIDRTAVRPTSTLRATRALRVKSCEGLKQFLTVLEICGFVGSCWRDVQDRFSETYQEGSIPGSTPRVNVVGDLPITDFIQLIYLTKDRFLETLDIAAVFEHFSLNGDHRTYKELRDNDRKRTVRSDLMCFRSLELQEAVKKALGA